MAKKLFSIAAAAAAICVSSSAFANLISVSPISAFRLPTFAERMTPVAPVPAGYGIFSWTVTTDSDILALENVQILGPAASASMYNHPFGDPNDANAIPPGFDLVFPSVTADTYMDTPGVTSRLGAPLPGDGLTTFGDLDNSGPQTDFKFAQLVLPIAAALAPDSRVNLRISINSTDSPGTPFSQDFTLLFVVPEPATFATAGTCLVGLIASARRRK